MAAAQVSLYPSLLDGARQQQDAPAAAGWDQGQASDAAVNIQDAKTWQVSAQQHHVCLLFSDPQTCRCAPSARTGGCLGCWLTASMSVVAVTAGLCAACVAAAAAPAAGESHAAGRLFTCWRAGRCSGADDDIQQRLTTGGECCTACETVSAAPLTQQHAIQPDCQAGSCCQGQHGGRLVSLQLPACVVAECRLLVAWWGAMAACRSCACH